MEKIDVVEREFRAMLAKMTGGVATQDYGTAFWDWWLNFAKSPEKQAELQATAVKQAMDLWRFNLEAAQGKPMTDFTLPELDAFWDEAKVKGL